MGIGSFKAQQTGNGEETKQVSTGDGLSYSLGKLRPRMLFDEDDYATIENPLDRASFNVYLDGVKRRSRNAAERSRKTGRGGPSGRGSFRGLRRSKPRARVYKGVKGSGDESPRGRSRSGDDSPKRSHRRFSGESSGGRGRRSFDGPRDRGRQRSFDGPRDRGRQESDSRRRSPGESSRGRRSFEDPRERRWSGEKKTRPGPRERDGPRGGESRRSFEDSRKKYWREPPKKKERSPKRGIYFDPVSGVQKKINVKAEKKKKKSKKKSSEDEYESGRSDEDNDDKSLTKSEIERAYDSVDQGELWEKTFRKMNNPVDDDQMLAAIKTRDKAAFLKEKAANKKKLLGKEQKEDKSKSEADDTGVDTDFNAFDQEEYVKNFFGKEEKEGETKDATPIYKGGRKVTITDEEWDEFVKNHIHVNKKEESEVTISEGKPGEETESAEDQPEVLKERTPEVLEKRWKDFVALVDETTGERSNLPLELPEDKDTEGEEEVEPPKTIKPTETGETIKEEATQQTPEEPPTMDKDEDSQKPEPPKDNSALRENWTLFLSTVEQCTGRFPNFPEELPEYEEDDDEYIEEAPAISPLPEDTVSRVESIEPPAVEQKTELPVVEEKIKTPTEEKRVAILSPEEAFLEPYKGLNVEMDETLREYAMIDERLNGILEPGQPQDPSNPQVTSEQIMKTYGLTKAELIDMWHLFLLLVGDQTVCGIADIDDMLLEQQAAERGINVPPSYMQTKHNSILLTKIRAIRAAGLHKIPRPEPEDDYERDKRELTGMWKEFEKDAREDPQQGLNEIIATTEKGRSVDEEEFTLEYVDTCKTVLSLFDEPEKFDLEKYKASLTPEELRALVPPGVDEEPEPQEAEESGSVENEKNAANDFADRLESIFKVDTETRHAKLAEEAKKVKQQTAGLVEDYQQNMTLEPPEGLATTATGFSNSGNPASFVNPGSIESQTSFPSSGSTEIPTNFTSNGSTEIPTNFTSTMGTEIPANLTSNGSTEIPASFVSTGNTTITESTETPASSTIPGGPGGTASPGKGPQVKKVWDYFVTVMRDRHQEGLKKFLSDQARKSAGAESYEDARELWQRYIDFAQTKEQTRERTREKPKEAVGKSEPLMPQPTRLPKGQIGDPGINLNARNAAQSTGWTNLTERLDALRQPSMNPMSNNPQTIYGKQTGYPIEYTVRRNRLHQSTVKPQLGRDFLENSRRSLATPSQDLNPGERMPPSPASFPKKALGEISPSLSERQYYPTTMGETKPSSENYERHNYEPEKTPRNEPYLPQGQQHWMTSTQEYQHRDSRPPYPGTAHYPTSFGETRPPSDSSYQSLEYYRPRPSESSWTLPHQDPGYYPGAFNQPISGPLKPRRLGEQIQQSTSTNEYSTPYGETMPSSSPSRQYYQSPYVEPRQTTYPISPTSSHGYQPPPGYNAPPPMEPQEDIRSIKMWKSGTRPFDPLKPAVSAQPQGELGWAPRSRNSPNPNTHYTPPMYSESLDSGKEQNGAKDDDTYRHATQTEDCYHFTAPGRSRGASDWGHPRPRPNRDPIDR